MLFSQNTFSSVFGDILIVGGGSQVDEVGRGAVGSRG
jgi:uncharacterized protein with ACT and thioredoxin-like domain